MAEEAEHGHSHAAAADLDTSAVLAGAGDADDDGIEADETGRRPGAPSPRGHAVAEGPGSPRDRFTRRVRTTDVLRRLDGVLTPKSAAVQPLPALRAAPAEALTPAIGDIDLTVSPEPPAAAASGDGDEEEGDGGAAADAGAGTGVLSVLAAPMPSTLAAALGAVPAGGSASDTVEAGATVPPGREVVPQPLTAISQPAGDLRLQSFCCGGGNASAGRRCGGCSITRDEIKLAIIIALTASFFVVELAVGLRAGSLALQSDAFHMLSDVASLVVGVFAMRSSRRTRDATATFGFSRYEVVGALANGVFLLAVCFTITLDAIQRFATGGKGHGGDGSDAGVVADTLMVLYVGCAGLGINLVGVVLLSTGHGHGHSHGGMSHGHSHGGGTSHGHAHAHNGEAASEEAGQEIEAAAHGHSHGDVGGGEHGHAHGGDEHGDHHGHAHGGDDGAATGVNVEAHRDPRLPPARRGARCLQSTDACCARLTCGRCHIGTAHAHGDGGAAPQAGGRRRPRRRMNMNIHGVLLHVIGDALGSVAVIIASSLMAFTSLPQRELADPAASLAIVAIIVLGTLPLVRQSAAILLQLTPRHVDVAALKALILRLPGIIAVHDFHVWQLDSSKVIASLHVVVDRRISDYRPVQDAVKSVLHGAGVHSSTVQPEYLAWTVQRRLEEATAAAAATATAAAAAPASGGEATPSGRGVRVSSAPARAATEPLPQSLGALVAGDALVDAALRDVCNEIVCSSECVGLSCCPPGSADSADDGGEHAGLLAAGSGAPARSTVAMAVESGAARKRGAASSVGAGAGAGAGDDTPTTVSIPAAAVVMPSRRVSHAVGLGATLPGEG